MRQLIRTTTIAMAAAATLIAAPSAGAMAAPATSVAVAEGLDVTIGGWAEGSAILPDGDILVSNLTRHLVQRIDSQTHEVTTVAEVADPSQMVVDGDTLDVVTGNSPASVLTRKGGVDAINLTTGARRNVTTGMGEANGMARLPDGDLVVSVTLGSDAGVHRVDPQTGERRRLTSSIATPNGVAVGPQGQVYIASTLLGAVFRVDPSTGAAQRVAGEHESRRLRGPVRRHDRRRDDPGLHRRARPRDGPQPHAAVGLRRRDGGPPHLGRPRSGDDRDRSGRGRRPPLRGDPAGEGGGAAGQPRTGR